MYCIVVFGAWFLLLFDILLYTFGYSITEVAQAIRQASSLVKSLTEGRWSKTILEVWLRLSWLNSTLPSRQDSSRLFDIKLGTWYLGGCLPLCHATRSSSYTDWRFSNRWHLSSNQPSASVWMLTLFVNSLLSGSLELYDSRLLRLLSTFQLNIYGCSWINHVRLSRRKLICHYITAAF